MRTHRMASSSDAPSLKVKTGDFIECDETVREMIKHLQDNRKIGMRHDLLLALL